ncbi:hypothetical protein B296_00032095 [Ensete ventricosum]|uniref:SRP54-type proteins GTP-binding domain-containing protein n=1 Tax=Ensete ventricosum TaxID=4639 RepID=A0A426Z2C6_ENSVE|nr:hypothetical protein B296_00032095 [Ensete ventricosum]
MEAVSFSASPYRHLSLCAPSLHGSGAFCGARVAGRSNLSSNSSTSWTGSTLDLGSSRRILFTVSLPEVRIRDTVPFFLRLNLRNSVMITRFLNLRGNFGVGSIQNLNTSVEGDVSRHGFQGKSCMLVAADVYRPAAVDQLQILGEKVGVPVYAEGTNVKPSEIAKHGLEEARTKSIDVVIVDTAGRLQIDKTMMDELKEVKRTLNPTEVLLVVDAMTGQEAAGGQNPELFYLTICWLLQVSGRPIKLVGRGERMEDLEPFYPDRMAGRILGMGDVLSFVEKAQEVVSESTCCSTIPNACTNEELIGGHARRIRPSIEQPRGVTESRAKGTSHLCNDLSRPIMYVMTGFLFIFSNRLLLVLQGGGDDRNRGNSLQARHQQDPALADSEARTESPTFHVELCSLPHGSFHICRLTF